MVTQWSGFFALHHEATGLMITTSSWTCLNSLSRLNQKAKFEATQLAWCLADVSLVLFHNYTHIIFRWKTIRKFFDPVTMTKSNLTWAEVVTQLVEQSLPIPEVCSSNPVIGKKYLYWTFVYCQLCIEKMKINKKEAGDGPFFKKSNLTFQNIIRT